MFTIHNMTVVKGKQSVSKKPQGGKKANITSNKVSNRPILTTDYSKPLKNDKYERFCQQYIIDNNATQAAIRAKYSEKTANAKGPALLVIVCISKRIKYLQAELSKASGVTAEMLMEEWRKIGFGNIKNAVRVGNIIRDVSQLPDEVAASISSVSTTKTGVKITMHSKETALENMGKMIGAYEKDNSQKKENLADFLKAMKDGQ